MKAGISTALAAALVASAEAACPSAPKTGSTTSLPNPFTFNDGTPVKSAADWTCRRGEIKSMLHTELGALPKSPGTVKGSMSGNTLTVTVTGAKTGSFRLPITYPAGGGAGPFPLMIQFFSSQVPVPAGVATAKLSVDTIAQQGAGVRNKGVFFDVNGAEVSGAGSLIGWSWAVSRIIDAVENTPGAKIDAKKVGVTGCSRYGKGALVAGAMDDRVVLTIPQESGSGGVACWRILDQEDGGRGKTQTAGQIVGENNWFSTAFNSMSKNVKALPYDHHMLIALAAPRGLLSIDNASPEWLGPQGSWGCMNAARNVYTALGVKDALGESMSTPHTHCQFPASQRPEVMVYMNKYLLGQASASASIFKAAAAQPYNEATWAPWAKQAPTLGA